MKISASKQSGFTLAEVLIVLGIIGVVAALTIPTLMKNYQKRVWVTALRRDVAYVQEGLRRMMAEEGVYSLNETELYLAVKEANDSGNNVGADAQDEAATLHYISKYFKDVEAKRYWDQQQAASPTGDKTGDVCKQYAGKGTLWYYIGDPTKCRGWRQQLFKMADGGTLLFGVLPDQPSFSNIGTNLTVITMSVIIDVNGEQGPNTWGRDAFYFYINSNGALYSLGSADVAKYTSNATGNAFDMYYWKTSSNVGYSCNLDNKNIYGMGCGARLIENNWVMDY